MFIICLISSSYVFTIEAHDYNMGVVGYDGITYDPCEPYPDIYPDITNSDGETWYYLVRDSEGEQIMHHLDDDLTTIYYKIYDYGENDSTITWDYNSLGESYRAFTEYGLTQWNQISIYKTNEDGHYYTTRLVNLVNVNTLENPNSVTPNLHIYPDHNEGSASGGCNAVEESIVSEDTQIYNGVRHVHYTQYKIYIAVNRLGYNFDNTIATIAHEVGHALGLADVDLVEISDDYGYHHGEILMGYGGQSNITYGDVAGAMITRGIHGDNDHNWLYDQTKSTEGNYKLICSLCNCVKYVSSLAGYAYNIYGFCQNNLSYEDAHTLESGNLMAVARYNKHDYLKCKYCKHITSFSMVEKNNYIYTGEYNQNTHILQNNVDNLEYTLEEAHDFSLEVSENVKKCSKCPLCDNGSVYVEVDGTIDLNCSLSNYTTSVTLDEGETKTFKINVSCDTTYQIKTLASSGVILEVFNENMIKQSESSYINLGTTESTYTKYLSDDLYIRIRFDDTSYAGTVNLVANSMSGYLKTDIADDEVVNILEHTHNNYSAFKYYTNEAEYISINVNATSISSDVIHPVGLIKVLDSSGNVINKYSTTNYVESAVSNAGQNQMVVYLPEAGTYTIEINYGENYADSATMHLEAIDTQDYVAFNAFTDVSENLYFDEATQMDNLTLFRTKQNQRFEINVEFESDPDATESILFVIINRVNQLDGTPVYTIVCERLLNINNNSYTLYFNFDDYRNYYIGYFGNNVEGIVNIDLTRCTGATLGSIVTDPDIDTPCGTEVTMNSGAYRGFTMEAGYTRLCYFDINAPSTSRLDYWWYTSNEDASIVTDYGTVYAKNVYVQTTITVMAIYKNDLTKVITQDFILLPDYDHEPVIKQYEITLSVGEVYNVNSENTWVSLYIQHYEWNPDSESIATITPFGKITAVSQGTTNIWGDYKYNDRYMICYTVTVV